MKGEGAENADGTVSYPMTATLTNEMSAADALPGVRRSQQRRRS